MWPDRVSSPGPLALESDALRYAAGRKIFAELIPELSRVSYLVPYDLFYLQIMSVPSHCTAAVHFQESKSNLFRYYRY